MDTASAGSNWVQTSDTDFNNGTLNNVVINRTGSAAELRLENSTWTQKTTSGKPSPRSSHAMASVYSDDKVVLFGGVDGSYDDETWVYDLSANTWTKQTTSIKPGARVEHAMASVYGDDKVVFFGGFDSGFNRDDETWVYDLSANNWTKKTPSTKPSARVTHAMAAIEGDDKVVLFGGVDGTNDDETWVYDLSANNWTKKTPSTKPSARYKHAMASVYRDDKVVLFGGYNGTNNDETWVYDLSANNWTKKTTSTKPSSRFKHAMASVYGDDKVVLFGGDDDFGGRDDETWVYDLSANNWTKKSPSTKPSARVEHAMASINGTDKVVLFGGVDGSYDGETWVFDLSQFGNGTFISKSFDTGGNSNFTGISWSANSPTGTIVKFQIATSNDNLTWSFKGPDGNSNTYYSFNQSIWSGHKDDRWVQYKVYFITDGSSTPDFQDVTINYNRIPGAPDLTDPPDDALSRDNTPSFNWSFIDTDGTQDAFQVLIDDDILFGSIDYNSGVQSSLNKYWEFPTGTSYINIVDGTWYWKVRTKDNDGDWGPYSTYRNIKIDTTIGTPLNVITSPNNWTKLKLFNISWDNPLDLTGITGVYYKLDTIPISNIDGTFISGDDINSISNVEVSADGEHTIYIWLLDKVGNVNYNNHTSINLYCDSSPPPAPIDITITPLDWTNKNSFTIDWTDPDDLSGTKAGAYYYIGNEPPSSQSLGTWTSNKPLVITSASEGENNIYLWLEDNVGNKNHLNYAYIALKYDPSSPEDLSVEINDDSLYTNEAAIKLDLTATDTISGLTDMSFSFDNKEWLSWEPFSTTKSITLPSGDGDKSVYFRVRDKAENIAKAIDSIILDITPPQSLSIVINSDADETNSTAVKLDLGVFDTTSGVHKMSFSTNGKTWTDWEDYSETRSFELPSGDGKKTLYFRVTDKAGNMAEAVSDSINLNTSTPVEPPKNQDRDGDGYTDDIDVFPDDPKEWLDGDSDGVGDNGDAFPTDSLESKDSDSDGVGDNSDAFPNDPTKWEKETKEPDEKNPDEKKSNVGLIAGIVIVIVVIILLLFFFILKPRMGVKPAPEEPEKKEPEKPAETEVKSYASQDDQYQSLYGDASQGTPPQSQLQDQQRYPPYQ